MNIWRFDPDATSAKTYEKSRQGYPDELYSRIFQYAGICPGSKVLEIGSGPGKATPPFLEAGCNVLAIEPGKQFSSL